MKFILLILITTSLASLAEATDYFTGADISGGGKVVVCRDQSQKILSAELLDLFEQRALYGLKTMPLGSDVMQSVGQIKDKLSALYMNAKFMTPKSDSVDKAVKAFRLLPHGVALLPIDDAAEIAVPIGCALEQLAAFQGNTTLLVNRDIWDALDPINQAALYIHEGLYYYERNSGDTNSKRTRKAVAYLFSDASLVPLFADMPAVSKTCTAAINGDENHSQFFFFYSEDPKNPDQASLQFLTFRGQIPYGKTTSTSFRWPWPNNYSDLYMLVTSDVEDYGGIMLRRTFDTERKNVTGYYFDEPEGKYLITCSDFGPNPYAKK